METPPRLLITKMVLTNFKSYGGQVEIGPFHKRFSSIVGPNGSGKSNVIDAMLFVFGKRAKKLRLNKVSELIHKSETYPDLDSASVSVHFADMIDGEGDSFTEVPGSQVVVTRTAFKSNASTYHVDGKQSTFTEVGELLRFRGIDLDNNRFLILQGEVEQIAMMKPKAPTEHEDGLLEYLEDIIGSNKYVEPITEQTATLEVKCDARAEKLQRLKAAEKEREALAGAKEEAEEYVRTDDDLRRCLNTTLQVLAHKCAKASEGIADRAAGVEAKLAEERGKNAELDSAKKKAVADVKGLQEAQKKVYSCLGRAKDDFNAFEKESIELKEAAKTHKAATKKLEATIEAAEVEIEEREASIELLEACVPRLSSSISASQEQKAQADETTASLRLDCDATTTAARIELEGKRAQLAPLKEFVLAAKREADAVTAEISLAKAGSSDAVKELEQRNYELTKAKISSSTQKGDLDKLRESQRDLEAKCAKLHSELGETLDPRNASARSAADEALAALESAKSVALRSKATTTKAVASVLKAASGPLKSAGVCGRLGDLGRIPEEYDVAISTACGMLDHIVVETSKGGQMCIEYLKQQQLGRASFIVLDQLTQWKARAAQKIQTPSNAPRLYDVVEQADAKFATAFYMALRDTLVAPDLDAAMKLAFPADGSRWRTVTTAGQVIDTSGTMSGGGGKPNKGKMGLVGSKGKASSADGADDDRAQAKAVASLGAAYAEAQAKADESAKLKAAAEDDLDGATRQLRRAVDVDIPKLLSLVEVSLATAASLSERVAALDKSTKKAVDAQKEEVDQLESKLARAVAALEAMKKEPKLAKLEKVVQQLQHSILDSASPALKAAIQAGEQLQAKIDALDSELSTATASSKSSSKALAKARERSLKAAAELTALEASGSKNQDALLHLEANAAHIKQRRDEATAEAHSHQEALSAKVEELAELTLKLSQAASLAVDLEAQRDDYKTALLDQKKQAAQHAKGLLELGAQHAREIADFGDVLLESRTAVYKANRLLLKQQATEDAAEEEDDEAVVDDEADVSKVGDDDDEAVVVKDEGAADVEDASDEAAAAAAPAAGAEEAKPVEFKFAVSDEAAVVSDEPSAADILALEAHGPSAMAKVSLDQVKMKSAQLKEKLQGMNSDIKVIAEYRIKAADYAVKLADLEAVTADRDSARVALDLLKAKRLGEFMAGFSHITLKLKEMYQMITLGGDAELELVDSLDPFSEGIVFSVRPPKKSWKHIANLSGGEKTLSSLALVFALHHYRPTPLYVMDEIDAALDYKNVSIIANYIKERCHSAQFIIISLRNNMFELADRLVGVYKTHNITKTITISPREFSLKLAAATPAAKPALHDATNGESLPVAS
mmetsp:Transcript_9903/g.32675  ORF Transcript_9903/g.32675 Transcript_9903/m.32675 type:complete len:1366 (+) Transcript_9903:88-4185(+)